MKLFVIIGLLYTLIAFFYTISQIAKRARKKIETQSTLYVKTIKRRFTIFSIGLLFILPPALVWMILVGKKIFLIVLILIVFGGSNVYFYFSLLHKSLKRKKIKTPSFEERIFKPIRPYVRILANPNFEMPISEFAKHTQVLATTGAGKTKGFVGPLLAQAIETGTGVLIIDPKGDKEILTAVLNLLKRTGRIHDFKYFDLQRGDLSMTYNPLLNGTPSQIAARVIATMPTVGGTATFYEEQQRKFARLIMPAILNCADVLHSIGKRRGKAINFADLYVFIRELPDSLRWLIKYTEEYGSVSEKDTLRAIGVESLISEIEANKRFKEWISGLHQHLSKFAFALEDPSLLNSYEPDINLLQDLMNSKIVYFVTPPLAYPGGESYELGKMILMDLMYVINWRQRNNVFSEIPIFAIIDEAPHVTPPEFIPAFEMGRSAGVAVALIHQSLQQFEEVEKGMAERIVQNTGTKIIMRIKHPETAEFFAKYIGEELKEFKSEMIEHDHPMLNVPEAIFPDTRLTITQRYDYKVRPEEFYSLAPGEAFVITPKHDVIKGRLFYFAEEYETIDMEALLPSISQKSKDSWRSPKGLNLYKEFKLNTQTLQREIKREEKTELPPEIHISPAKDNSEGDTKEINEVKEVEEKQVKKEIEKEVVVDKIQEKETDDTEVIGGKRLHYEKLKEGVEKKLTEKINKELNKKDEKEYRNKIKDFLEELGN